MASFATSLATLLGALTVFQGPIQKVYRYEETLKDVFVRKKICLPFMVSTRLLNQIDAARYENAPRDQRGVGDRPLEEPTKLVNELSNEKECKC